jgi:hypothetical protein
VMKKVADFLGVSYTQDQEQALLDHLSFSSMKNNKAVNFEDDLRQIRPELQGSFIREGKVGVWRKVLSPEFAELFEAWTEKNLKGTDYPRILVDKPK